ncbi:MAG: hypothetical protein U9P72_05300 [Campylobacterota bacterium]|nr:hypothetical protein [Campylobacterota bacterium]
MKLKTTILMVLIVFFIGCSDEDIEIMDSSITPQPSVEDESVRPPKPPSI